MSKKTTIQTEKAGLSLNAKRSIVISAICVVMAIVLAVSIVLVVKNSANSDDTDSNNNSGSSSLYIKNGDFSYFDTDTDTYPKSADDDNWTTYTYKEPDDDGETHGFTKIESTVTDDVVSGVVSTDEDEWDNVAEDLAYNSITNVSNPGTHSTEDADSTVDKNVFVFATKNATSASIVSTSFSVGSLVSAKVTVWLNTQYITSGGATLMLQQYSSTLSALDTYRYAYTFDIPQTDGWVAYELYLFNRTSSSKSVVLSVGIGNTYEGTTAEGILFVDDITYETLTANDYREYVASATDATNYYSIGSDEEDTASYSVFTDAEGNVLNAQTLDEYLNSSDAIVSGKSYSPFTVNDKFEIYSVSNDGTVRDTVALVISQWQDGSDIVIQSSEDAKDHLHISFWLRVKQNGRVTAQANIVLQSLNENGKWEDVDSSSFTSVVTSQEIQTDDNCGWVKYDYYVKPINDSAKSTTLRILCALGNTNGYSDDAVEDYLPKGTLFATSPLVENVSSSDYSSASGTYTKKVSLVGDTASTSVTNGSFSSTASSTSNQPSDWTATFGGANIIYKDGKGNLAPSDLPQNASDVTAAIIKNSSLAPSFDDSERNFLQITNNVATSFGYISDDLTLSANTVYAVSVLARTENGTKPYIYLVRSDASDRTEAILGSVTSNATSTADDASFGMISSSDEGNGWTRYYIVVVTGDESITAHLALFNGSIDGLETQQGTVCYDIASLSTLGTYSIDTTEYEDDAEDAPETLRDRITYTASSGYTVFDELTESELSEIAENDNVVVWQPDWDTMIEEAIEEANADDDDDDSDDDDSTSTSSVDWGLLASVVSSVAMIAALMIVAVIQIFKKRARKS